MLRLQLLGAPIIRVNEQPVPLPSQKAQALLFYLHAEADRPATRGQIVALLWEESSEKEGRNSLSTVLSRLRSALSVVPIRTDGDGLAWDSGANATSDIAMFHVLTQPIAGEEVTTARLETAAALYRGPFLDGFEVRDSVAYDEWLRLERERWHYRVMNLLDQLVDRHTKTGNLGRATIHARAAVALDPLQERFHRSLMRLAALSGDRAGALTQFRLCRDILERELGVEPDPETRALEAQIRAGAFANQREIAQAVAETPQPSSFVRAPEPPLQASAEPPHRLASRLETARRQSFVGRQAELQLFSEALAQDEPPFTVLHLHGPGGVGKSTLLAAFARHAADVGIRTILIDGRTVEPTGGGLLGALREQVGDGGFTTLPNKIVLLFDTYEHLTPIESWLRDVLLPQLPVGALVVFAGRNPPSAGWRADPGWQAMSRALRLDNLSTDDAADYLRRRAVPVEQHGAVLRATHGFPLGLSLATEVILQRPNDRFEGLDAPDVVQTLLERFVDRVLSVAHRAALEAASQVRVVDEPLLAAMLAHDEARELFDWLGGLSFVWRGRRGLFLHDLAREALAADLRWRNPVWHNELHNRARGFYATAIAKGNRVAQQQALFGLIFLHNNPLIRSSFIWSDAGGLLEDSARLDDWPSIAAMIKQYEGAESARIAGEWFHSQITGTSVFRDSAGAPVGFNQIVTLRHDSTIDDPCLAGIKDFLAQQPALQHGQFVAIDRFWMDRDTYQGISPTQALIFIAAIRFVLTTPGLAASFHVFADPETWLPATKQVRFTRLAEADFTAGGRRYGVFYHDWRAEPPQAWLAILAEQETGD